MKFRRISFEDKRNERRVSRYMLFTIVIAILPSFYLTYRIVNQSVFERNAEQFVKEQLQFKNTLVVSKTFNYATKKPRIEVLLIGKEISSSLIDTIKGNLKKYQLNNVELVVKQGLNAQKAVDLSQIKNRLLEELIERDSLSSRSQQNLQSEFPDIREELKVLYPTIVSYSFNRSVVHATEIGTSDDTLTYAILKFKSPIKTADRLKLSGWLKRRLGADSLSLVVE